MNSKARYTEIIEAEFTSQSVIEWIQLYLWYLNKAKLWIRG